MPTTLITGATDGIGLALATQYAAQGHRLLLIGRRPLASLQAHPSALFNSETYIEADLSQADAYQTVAAAIANRNITHLDLAIHNAGLGYVGDIAGQSAESINTLITVNTTAPIQLTHALLPQLLNAKGKVVFISSVVSAIACPDFAVYGASKAALDGFARSLKVEMAGRIGVQVIHPGATRTGMHAKSVAPGGKVINSSRFVSAEKVAHRIINAIKTNKPAVTIGTGNAAIQIAGRRFSRVTDRLMRKSDSQFDASSGQPHALITGAADGIGRSLALRYAKAGYRVTGVDVDVEKAGLTSAELKAISKESKILIADLTSDLEWANLLSPVDVIIHNAGISATGHFASIDPEHQAKVIALNLTAPLQLTARLLKHNLLTHQSAFVFLSSLSRYVSYPGATGYSASKDGLAHYGRSLAVALHGSSTVTTVYPGPTRTAHASRYAPDNRNERSRMSPKKLAKKIFKAQQKGRPRLLPGGGARFSAALGTLAPNVAEKAMRKAILDKFPVD